MTHRTESHPSAPADVDLALRVAASVQKSIEHGDTKLAALAAGHGALLTAVLSSAPPAAVTPAVGSWPIATAYLSGAVLIVSVVASAWHLSAGFWPRLQGIGERNRFGFPALARARSVPVVNARRSREEAWQMAIALSNIASHKYQRVRAALVWTIVSGCAAAMWVISLSVLLHPR